MKSKQNLIFRWRVQIISVNNLIVLIVSLSSLGKKERKEEKNLTHSLTQLLTGMRVQWPPHFMCHPVGLRLLVCIAVSVIRILLLGRWADGQWRAGYKQ